MKSRFACHVKRKCKPHCPTSRGTALRASPGPARIRPRAPICPASIKVLPWTFNPQNRTRYPSGSPFSLCGGLFFYEPETVVWMIPASFACGKSLRAATTSCRAARADARSRRPAIVAKISSTRPGRITSCAMISTRWRKSARTSAFRSFSAGCTNRKPKPFSNLAATIRA